MPAGIGGDEPQTVYQRAWSVIGIEVGEHVGHRDEHGETGSPSGVAVGGAVLGACAHDRGGLDAEVEQTEHRFADHERDLLFQAVVQAPLEVPDRVVDRARRNQHVVAVDVHVERGGVVGPEVERAARLQVETSVMPVTGEQPGLDAALMQREPHMRTAVFDRPGPVVVPEHDDRDRADLGHQLTVTPERVERSGTGDTVPVDGPALAGIGQLLGHPPPTRDSRTRLTPQRSVRQDQAPVLG